MTDDNPVQTSPGDAPRAGTIASRGWIAAILVLLAAAAIVLYKETRSHPSSDPSFALGANPTAAGGSVLLVADPDEAGSACGCGEIIRIVRDAGARGVAVREVAPGSDISVEREYGVVVAPTVLFLDSSGQVVARHEGEGAETIEAIHLGLDRLAAGL